MIVMAVIIVVIFLKLLIILGLEKVGKRGLQMNFEQYALVGSTVRSYLAWLKESGRLNARFEDNMLLWERA